MADAGTTLKKLVDDVVLAQGNDFIKELLRDKHLKIGVTKADFRANLHAAIDQGLLTGADVEVWLHRVEGWGAQHVYLYTVPPALAKDPLWTDPDEVRRRSGRVDLWGATSSYAYPADLTLTGVYFDSGRLRYVWHRGTTSRERDKSRDTAATIDGDEYEFDAYRRRRERTVMRFELRLAERLAAAFLQEPITGDSHAVALDQMWDTVAPVVPEAALTRFNVSRLITRLDDRGTALGIRSPKTRLVGQSAYAEFGSLSDAYGYRDDEAIRESRLALRSDGVSGDRSEFVIPIADRTGPGEVRMSFYGRQRRMWLRAQVTEAQLWSLLRLFKAQG